MNQGDALRNVRVGCYPTAKSLPLHVGINQGFFQDQGIRASLHFHDNSRLQRDSLANGNFDLIHIAVDNAVAMVEDDGLDVVIVLGGDSGMNEFFVQPEIQNFDQLRGKRIVVDAVDTAYALQAIKILADHGLTNGRDYVLDPVGRGAIRLEVMKRHRSAAGAVHNPPYSLQAEDLGFKSLGRTAELMGGYQASGACVMRTWAEANRETLVRYLTAYLQSLRWVRLPANRSYCEQLLCDELKLEPKIARRSLDQLLDTDFGFTIDAKIDRAGFANVLALRRMVISGKARSGHTPATDSMIDLSYSNAALQRLDVQKGDQ
jgi:ABC-type nitrate/sulfonate/bicarbonate transport system substrate-binding protein